MEVGDIGFGRGEYRVWGILVTEFDFFIRFNLNSQLQLTFGNWWGILEFEFTITIDIWKLVGNIRI